MKGWVSRMKMNGAQLLGQIDYSKGLQGKTSVIRSRRGWILIMFKLNNWIWLNSNYPGLDVSRALNICNARSQKHVSFGDHDAQSDLRRWSDNWSVHLHLPKVDADESARKPIKRTGFIDGCAICIETLIQRRYPRNRYSKGEVTVLPFNITGL